MGQWKLIMKIFFFSFQNNWKKIDGPFHLWQCFLWGEGLRDIFSFSLKEHNSVVYMSAYRLLRLRKNMHHDVNETNKLLVTCKGSSVCPYLFTTLWKNNALSIVHRSNHTNMVVRLTKCNKLACECVQHG